MKIWILNHYAVTPRTIGGTRHFDLAVNLVSKGHEVRIFAASFNHFERKETVKYEKSYYKEDIIDSVNFTWIKTPAYNNSLMRLLNIAAFTLRLSNTLKKYIVKETPDLIIGSSVHPFTALVGLEKAKRTKSLFYFEERDLWPQTFIDFGLMTNDNIIAKYLFKIEKKLYKESDRVIFLFERAHEYAIQKGLETNKPIYLPNGYSIERSLTLKENTGFRNLITDLGNKKLCLYVGSFGEANHIAPLLDLAHYMKEEEDYHFIFVGGGPQKSDLIRTSQDKGMSNITFIDPIPKEQIPYLLSFAHCGLISMKDSPLYKWGFSMNKIYDYLSTGLPIIAYTNLKDLGKLENQKGFISSTSLEILKNEVISIKESDRKEIREFAYANYSWEILSSKLLKEIELDLKLKNEIEV